MSPIAAPSEMTALEYVITSAQEEIARLDLMIENILVTEGPERFVFVSLEHLA